MNYRKMRANPICNHIDLLPHGAWSHLKDYQRDEIRGVDQIF